MYGYIYKTTCLINGKIYIGQHKAKQFEPEKYMGSGVQFNKAVKQHGKENFKCELVESFEDRESLNRAEIYYISLFDARNPEIGYNSATGGDYTNSYEKFSNGIPVGCFGLKGIENKNSIERRIPDILPYFEEVWRVNTKGKTCRFFHIGSKCYEECLKRLGLSDESEERQNFLKRHRVEKREETLNIRGSRKRQPIKCVETGQIFESITAARKFLGLNTNNSLYVVLRDNSKTCRGYHWIKVDK